MTGPEREKKPYRSLMHTLGPHVRRMLNDMSTILRMVRPWRHRGAMVPYLNIENTNICNANCIFCAYQYQDRFRSTRGVMDSGVFEKAVHEHKGLGGSFITIAPMLGEPRIDPRFVERLCYVSENGFDVSFFTNGILLKRIDLDHLLESGVERFALSTAPFSREHFKAIYRSDRYDDLLQGAVAFLETRNRRGADLAMEIAFRSSVPPREALMLSDFRNKIWPLLNAAERKAMAVSIRGFDSWGGQIRQEDLLGVMKLALPPRVKRRPCKWTFVPMVMWDGLVRACACRFTELATPDGRDDLVVGDIREHSLAEIWHGARVKQLRERFARGDLPKVCEACTMYRPC